MQPQTFRKGGNISTDHEGGVKKCNLLADLPGNSSSVKGISAWVCPNHPPLFLRTGGDQER
jgi:hypothetical protein